MQLTPCGNYEWIYFRDEALRPPPPERRPVGRPPGRGRGRRARDQAPDIYDPEQAHEHEEADDQPAPRQEPRLRRQIGSSSRSGPSRQSTPVQDQIARHFLDIIFNSTRASILAGQEFDIAPAPPGWQMGDPIPPEYLRPRRR